LKLTTKLKLEEIISELKSMGKIDEHQIIMLQKYGINVEDIYGVKLPDIRAFAKKIGKDHKLAQELWILHNRETMILATLIEDKEMVTETQIDEWVSQFNSWEICDQCCINLIVNLSYAHRKAMEWSERHEEFVKRAGFSLMAVIAVHDKKSNDSAFYPFLDQIKKHATDERNFVKKSVNWALRQIGKRNKSLNEKTINLAQEILKLDSKAARWNAKDAIKELESESVHKKFI
jgi:3-methyladenine DNA glycosylase AlkD